MLLKEDAADIFAEMDSDEQEVLIKSFNDHELKEVITETEKVVGKPISSKMDGRRAGDPATLTASSKKAQEVLGWKPKMNDLNQIIATAWNWHKNHKNGFED